MKNIFVNRKFSARQLQLVPKLPAPQIRTRRLSFVQNWGAVRHMFRNYAGVDPFFERETRGRVRSTLKRYVQLPLYYGLLNQGYALWVGRKLAGMLYLQHRRLVTHVNDIEVNVDYQGRGYGHALLQLAEEYARRRRKRFMTLAVTLSNQRAVKLYTENGYLPQHHHYYYLSRPSWADPPAALLSGETENTVTLRPLSRGSAAQNLRRAFRTETRAAETITAPVWERHYAPGLPKSGQGLSFGILWGDSDKFEGHADFFNYGERGRWRIYLPPNRWGGSDEQALLQLVINQSHSFNHLWITLGSTPHHQAVQSLATDLGLTECEGERMLMVKPLN